MHWLTCGVWWHLPGCAQSLPTSPQFTAGPDWLSFRLREVQTSPAHPLFSRLVTTLNQPLLHGAQIPATPTVGWALRLNAASPGSLLQKQALEPRKFTDSNCILKLLAGGLPGRQRIWWALGGFSSQHCSHFCGNDCRELPVRWPHGDTGQGRSFLLNRHWFNKQISELWIISHLHLGY